MPNPFPYQMILAAKTGDQEALTAVLRHYTTYIAFLSKRPFYDEYGNRYEFVDEGIRKNIEAKLLFQIVYKFDPNKLPDGETLQVN